jgi:hypothetical protein
MDPGRTAGAHGGSTRRCVLRRPPPMRRPCGGGGQLALFVDRSAEALKLSLPKRFDAASRVFIVPA